MAKIRRVDFSPDEWIVGTRELTLEERGAYWDVCSLIYSRGGPIADDDAWIAKALACHMRTWRAIKGRLVAKGKLRIEGGFITNSRSLQEIERAEKRVSGARTAAEKSAEERRKRAENSHLSLDYNDIPEADAHISGEANYQPSTSNDQPPTTTLPEESYSEAPREASTAPRQDVTAAHIDEAFALWAPVAYALSIPDPGFPNSDRRRLIAARLAECGMDGWRRALTNLRNAQWLRDSHDPSRPMHWVNLATLLKPENFTGLLENRYAERRRNDKSDERSVHAGVAGFYEAGSR